MTKGVLAELAALAGAADGEPHWPEASWQALRRSGALRWCVPAAYGGEDRTGPDLLAGYERLAGACLTTCFILSQRDAAVRRIRDSGNEALCRELLPPLARGDAFATVGLSQLTTSRQHVRPAMTARLTEAELVLDGAMPWVTGAERADWLVAGAVLADGRQVLAVVPRGTPGLRVGPPLPLMALEGSLTAEVRCEGAAVARRWLLAGPAQQVLATGRGAGGLETSCLALGLAGAAVDYLTAEAAARPDLRATADRLEQARSSLRADLHRAAGQVCSSEAAAQLRARANALVLRATQAALTAAKGAGFLRTHPAQRWARQAMFFLVWSCPRPAVEATLAYLAPPCV
ncbi:MAG TPA: acyl-CoA dehydrogenase family protein [Gemmataceae bacterium]|nr:acyl-CoA dehydrogenase family protein [Gemmataceae bacterium]